MLEAGRKKKRLWRHCGVLSTSIKQDIEMKRKTDTRPKESRKRIGFHETKPERSKQIWAKEHPI